MKLPRRGKFKVWKTMTPIGSKHTVVERWFWHLKHANGEIICQGEPNGYASKQKAKQGIRSVCLNAPFASITEANDG